MIASANRTRKTGAQLAMPGMSSIPRSAVNATRYNLSPGQVVHYLGNLSGGPRYGSRGIVREVLGRRAIVDMGRVGRWHIPYYFLSVSLRWA